MKRYIPTLLAMLALHLASHAQDSGQADVVDLAKQERKALQKEYKETKKARKAIDRSERERKKEAKAEKKAGKEARKSEKLDGAINTKRKSIRKADSKIEKLQRKLHKEKSEGRLSAVDEAQLDQKIDRLKINRARDKEKLAKLERKQ